MTEADNIFEEEQLPQISEVIPPTPAVSKASFDPNQVDHEATADAWSENLIIQPGQVSLDSDDIMQLCACRLEVHDDNEPVPENAWTPLVQEHQRIWTVLTTCHQKAAGMSNLKECGSIMLGCKLLIMMSLLCFDGPPFDIHQVHSHPHN